MSLFVSVEGDVTAAESEQEAVSRSAEAHPAASIQPSRAGTRQAQPVRALLPGGKGGLNST